MSTLKIQSLLFLVPRPDRFCSFLLGLLNRVFVDRPVARCWLAFRTPGSIQLIGLLSGLLILSSCDSGGSVDFKGGRLHNTITPAQKDYAQAASVSEGGKTHALLPSGKYVSFSVGAGIKNVTGVTTNGFSVQYNIQGKLDQ